MFTKRFRICSVLGFPIYLDLSWFAIAILISWSLASVDEFVESYVYRLHHKMFPVTDNGRLIGCVTTRDVQKVPRNEWATTTVAHISRECEKENTIAPSSDAIQALAKMSQAGVSRMMVVDGERLVGLLSLSDLMKFIALKMELEDVDGARSCHLPSLRRVDAINQSLRLKSKGSNGRVVETH